MVWLVAWNGTNTGEEEDVDVVEVVWVFGEVKSMFWLMAPSGSKLMTPEFCCKATLLEDTALVTDVGFAICTERLAT